MHTAEVDVTLSRLQQAVERVGANLVALEHDEVRELLEATPLRGETAQRWHDARTKLAALFDDYARLTSVLERATELRRRFPPLSADTKSQLTLLLQGPSVEVAVKSLPLSERSLFDPSTKVSRETPEQVLARMAEPFRFVNECVSMIGHLWDELVPRLAALRQDLELAGRRCCELGSDWDDDLRAERARLDRLGSNVLADPLSVAPTEINEVEQNIASLREDVDRAYGLRAEMTMRLSAAHEALDRLEIAHSSAAQLRGEVTTKVASLAIPELPSVDMQLREQLASLGEDAHRGNWRLAAETLAAWWTAEQRAEAQVQAIIAEAEAALARRRELRGRLDAYSAKAARLGLSEDIELARMHDAAQNALYTAPSDLDFADDLIHQYQRAIASPCSERKTPM